MVNNTMAAGPNPNCKRDCADCYPQFYGALLRPNDLSEAKMTSNADAKQICKSLAEQTKADLEYIRKTLAINADAVLSRWKSRTPQQREKLILQALPEIYRSKYPEQRMPYGLGPKITSNVTAKNAFLLPYLTVQNLKADATKLLSLFYHRSNAELQGWVTFDAQQMKQGFETTDLNTEYNENNVILSDWPDNRYGDLVKWNRQECHKWNFVGYPRARLILDAQAVLLRFLRKMTDLVAPSATTNAGCVKWNALISAGFQQEVSMECWSSYSEQLFSAPPKYNLAQCLKNAQAQLAVAQDHLHFVRTDPAYTQDIYAKLRRGEQLRNMAADEIWRIIASDIMVYPVQHIRRLRNLVDECKHALAVFQKYQDNVKIGGSLPEDYEHALSGIEFLCINLLQHERIHLNKLLRVCPGFNRNFDYYEENGQQFSKLCDIAKSGDERANDKAWFQKDLLLWALMKLTKDPEHVPPRLHRGAPLDCERQRASTC